MTTVVMVCDFIWFSAKGGIEFQVDDLPESLAAKAAVFLRATGEFKEYCILQGIVDGRYVT